MSKLIFSTLIKTEGCDSYLDTWVVDNLTEFEKTFEEMYKHELYSVFEYQVSSAKIIEESDLRKYVKTIISTLVEKYQNMLDDEE